MGANNITEKKQKLQKLLEEKRNNIKVIVNEAEKEKIKELRDAIDLIGFVEDKLELAKEGQISGTELDLFYDKISKLDRLRNIQTKMYKEVYKDDEYRLWIEDIEGKYILQGELSLANRFNSGYSFINDSGEAFYTYSTYIETGISLSEELSNLLQTFKQKVNRIKELKKEYEDVLNEISRMDLIARKGLTGYYKFKDGKTYEIDFSKEYINPIPVDSIPADAEYSVEYNLISLSDKELQEFEKDLKNFLINILKEHGSYYNEEEEENEDMEEISNKIINFILKRFETSAVPSSLYVKRYPNQIHTYGEIYYHPADGFIKRDYQLLKLVDREDLENISSLPNTFDFTGLAKPNFFLVDDESFDRIYDILSKYLVVELDEFQDRNKMNGIVYIHSIKEYNLLEKEKDNGMGIPTL